MSRHTPRSGIRRYANLVNLGGLLIVVCTTVPLFWMASASFKGPGEISATPPTLLPESATPDNYDIAFVRNGIGHYFLNSVVVACCSTVLILSWPSSPATPWPGSRCAAAAPS